MSLAVPSDDALSGMPGDLVVFDTGECLDTQVIKTAGWQPTGNGGRVWTYETQTGVLVPNTAVREVKKRAMPPSESVIKGIHEESHNAKLEQALDLQSFLSIVDRLEISTVAKTAIYCIVNGSIKHLEVASFLCDLKAKELRELHAVGFANAL